MSGLKVNWTATPEQQERLCEISRRAVCRAVSVLKRRHEERKAQGKAFGFGSELPLFLGYPGALETGGRIPIRGDSE